MKPPVLIITGYGLNCEAESKAAWEISGADPRLIHLNDLLDAPSLLHDHKILMLIGGFSFGDHLAGSGHVLALRIAQRMKDHIGSFIQKGGLILGICNGFQTMVKTGLLPGFDNNYFIQKLALMHNDCGVFQNFWVRIAFEPDSPCVFTRGLSAMDLPVRHGEGRLFTADRNLMRQIESSRLVACRYADPETNLPASAFPHNPNGSLNAVAGLCDPTGRVFGLMPHPEAYIFPENHPRWQYRRLNGTLPPEGEGLKIFRNAVDYWQ